MKFNAHIIASGDIETKRVFIGNASGLTNIPAAQLTGTVVTGNLPSDVVFDADLDAASGILDAQIEASGLVLNTKIDVASGDLQAQIDAVSAGSVMSVSGVDGGDGFMGDVLVSGLGAQIYGSGAHLVIEPDVRRAELVFSSPVNTAILTHGYGDRPVVQIYDDSECQVFADVFHNSVNEVRVEFLETQTGRLIVIG